jgi:hypothetical protein
MPITHNLGFVIERTAPGQSSESTSSMPGYFVVRRHGDWLRLDSIPQTAWLRWPLTSGPAGTPRVAIADKLAFVVQRRTAEGGSPRAIATAVGYFVAERGGHWVRLNPIAHGALFGGPLTDKHSGIGSVSITADLSFVIEQPVASPRDADIPSALGYFLVKDAGRSLRLTPIGEGALFRQPSSPGG